MERTEPAAFVFQMPRGSVEQVQYRDAVEDHQALLNESWASYSVRRGYAPFRASEEHVKWVTETWNQYEARVIVRTSYLTRYFGLQKERFAQDELNRQKSMEVSKNLVAKLLADEKRFKERLMKPMHTLYVDFDERQQEKMRVERLSIEENEAAARALVKAEEAASRKDFELSFARAFDELLQLLEQRRIAKEEDERRLQEEQRRKAEEMRLLEEARRREAEAADKAAREAEEEAKRAERKRREEERKNKAKAEREARARQVKAEQEAIEAQAQVPDAPPPVPEKAAEPEIITQPVPKEEIKIFDIAALPSAESIADLFVAATNAVKAVWEECYIVHVANNTSMVVSHNGEVVGKKKAVKSLLLGKQLHESSCVTLSSKKIHSNENLPAYDRSELINDVKEDPRCFMFTGGEKRVETLLLVPCLPALAGGYVVAVCKQGAASIDIPNAKAIAAFIESQLAPQLERLLHRQRVSKLAQQAIDWLSITTCCKNCYIAISDTPKQPQVLTITSTTPTQVFLVGKKLDREEELSTKTGVSFALIDESLKTGQPEVAHISDVMDESTNKVNNQPLKFLGEKKKGSLLLCPILRPSQPVQGQAFGVVYADTLNDEKIFNKADEDMIRTTAVLLAELLDSDFVPPTTSTVQLAIEKDILGENADAANSPIRFLKHIWLRVNTDISMITSGQLLELSKYNHPPPIIPITIAATLLVALGSTPKSVENWDDARKEIKTSLVEKIVAFDPTDSTKRKKPFFIRARKITANYSAHDVFTRGSYPASCFFTWTYVTILLRRSADALRKATKAAGIEGVPLELLAGEAEDNEVDVAPEQEEDIDEDKTAEADD